MLTQEQVLEHVRKPRDPWECLDGRDYARLVDFFPVDQWKEFGFTPKEEAKHEPKPWTREAILDQLKVDLAFAFDKALGKRGISAGLMRSCVKQWLWVLEDNDIPEADEEDYAQYGLPLLKAVAVKYGFPNEIGDDRGDEYKYSSEADR